MKKLITMILCLALISLACLDTTAAVVISPKMVTAAPTSSATATAGAAVVKIDAVTASPAQVCAIVMAVRSQNLRAGAGTSFPGIGILLNGEVVRVTDQSDGAWWRVVRGDDIGFARSIYLEVVECDHEQP